MTTPLHEQLTNRAVKLMADDVSFELACSRARTELEEERKRELHDAHCRALDEWARARSRESIADGRDVLRRVGERLREDAELSPKSLASAPGETVDLFEALRESLNAWQPKVRP